MYNKTICVIRISEIVLKRAKISLKRQFAIKFSILKMFTKFLFFLLISVSLTTGLIVKTNVDDLVAVVQVN